MKYCAPNINKFIVNLWKLTAYLESTFIQLPWIPIFKAFTLI